MLIVAGSVFVACSSPSRRPDASCDQVSTDLSLFVAGDAIITQPWSQVEEPDFLRLVDEIREADVAVVNLEMLIHEFKGYPQALVLGTHMAARPIIAKELAWAGFDMVGHANNHTYDYGDIGVLENLEHVRQAGLVLAGSGEDLQRARAPAYFRSPKGTVALVAAASTFSPQDRATPSRHDVHGKPGVNPLAISWKTRRITRRTTTTVDPKDLEEILGAIREAEANADIVVFSLHAHRQKSWLVQFAHQAVDAGVDVFIGHGPHEVKGVEIYRCKPIFYGLGDFVFQDEQIEKLPAEFYERYGLGDAATPEDAQNARSAFGTRGFPSRREVWEGIAATVEFKDGALDRVRLIPVDLGFGKPLPIRGRPKLASTELAKKIVGDVIGNSRRYGTDIDYWGSANTAVIKIKRDAPFNHPASSIWPR
jgi:poly-gamma-glutamate synthesis protein (capsule biosynthesis protein)